MQTLSGSQVALSHQGELPVKLMDTQHRAGLGAATGTWEELGLAVTRVFHQQIFCSPLEEDMGVFITFTVLIPPPLPEEILEIHSPWSDAF